VIRGVPESKRKGNGDDQGRVGLRVRGPNRVGSWVCWSDRF